jgi:hypothetical protein
VKSRPSGDMHRAIAEASRHRRRRATAGRTGRGSPPRRRSSLSGETTQRAAAESAAGRWSSEGTTMSGDIRSSARSDPVMGARAIRARPVALEPSATGTVSAEPPKPVPGGEHLRAGAPVRHLAVRPPRGRIWARTMSTEGTGRGVSISTRTRRPPGRRSSPRRGVPAHSHAAGVGSSSENSFGLAPVVGEVRTPISAASGRPRSRHCLSGDHHAGSRHARRSCSPRGR